MTSMRRMTFLATMCALGLLIAACTAAEEEAPTATPSPATPTELEGVSMLSTAMAAFGTPTGTPAHSQWDAPPEMAIDPQTVYLATFRTDKGDIIVELFAEEAPLAVNNFVFLAREGFYDDTTFFRVIQDFMAQGGDPTETGAGGPGYVFEDEFTPKLLFDGPGYLAMANRGASTNGSQFFITFAATPWLNARHTIFGKIVEGMDVLAELTLRNPDENPTSDGDLLLTVIIEEIPESLLPTPTATPIPIVPEVQDGRPLADIPVAERANLYTGSPAMVIDTAVTYHALIETTKGLITIELQADEAPDLVNNFVVLADLGYWDGFPVAYIEPDVFLLTGSPAGDPSSDIGYTLPLQGDLSNIESAVGYWFRQDLIAPSGSQFYILMTDLGPVLDAYPTVFGYVVDGMEIVAELAGEDVITSITIAIPE